MNAALLSPCRRTRRGTVRPARHLSTRCPRHQHTRVRQTRRSRSLLSGHSPAGVRRLPLRRKAAPQRQCSSSSRARASIATITSCRAPASRANQESRSSRSRCDATTARNRQSGTAATPLRPQLWKSSSPAWLLTQGQRKPPALAARSTVDCWIAPIASASTPTALEWAFASGRSPLPTPRRSNARARWGRGCRRRNRRAGIKAWDDRPNGAGQLLLFCRTWR